MTTKRQTSIIIIVVLHVVFFAVWFLHESGKLSSPGHVIKVQPLPVDPRDLISGQYMRLDYEFGRAWMRYDTELQKAVYPDWLSEDVVNLRHGDVWVVMHEVNGLYEVKKTSLEKPNATAEGEVVIKGVKRRNAIKYGIERLYVPEGTLEPNRNDMIMELNVYENGMVRIKQAYVKGVMWP